jgi:hypothetical protein
MPWEVSLAANCAKISLPEPDFNLINIYTLNKNFKFFCHILRVLEGDNAYQALVFKPLFAVLKGSK